MENGRRLLRWTALAAWIMIVVGGGMPSLAWALPDAKARPTLEARPDLVLVDAIGQKKKLEMPPAVFLHDSHTQALAGEGCTVCHTALGKPGVKYNPFGFMSVEKAKNATQMEERYHKGCLTCHAAMAGRDAKTGPQAGECRVCHNPAPPYVAKDAPAGMDKALHYQHIASKDIQGPDNAKENCGACHHVYDEKLKKLVWKQGKEDACSACHAAEAQGSTPSLQTASHTSCVQCHVEQNARNVAKSVVKDAAIVLPGLPVTCAACHGETPVTAKPRTEPVPRLMRDQPDTVLFVDTSRVGTGDAANVITGVIFDHKGHEAALDSCRVCHQHTTPGSGEGAFTFPTQRDMHDPTTEQSCIGCHQKRVMEQTSCVGCHKEIKPLRRESSCGVCHVDVTKLVRDNAALFEATQGDADAREALAAKALEVRPTPVKPLEAAEVPDKVNIGALANEYDPAVMPHRKIYAALQKGIAGNALAAAFHSDPLSTCAACHHNSPVSELRNPPKCASCHPIDGTKQPAQDKRPSLKAAYHQQCMACHEGMQVKPVATDCTGCHVQRATSGPLGAGGKE